MHPFTAAYGVELAHVIWIVPVGKLTVSDALAWAIVIFIGSRIFLLVKSVT
jgi:hypothetical protein